MLPIAYGMPDDGLVEASERGEVEIGGCVIWPGNPDFVCQGTERHCWQRTVGGGLVAIGASGADLADGTSRPTLTFSATRDDHCRPAR
jgi:hypothetical protein